MHCKDRDASVESPRSGRDCGAGGQYVEGELTFEKAVERWREILNDT